MTVCLRQLHQSRRYDEWVFIESVDPMKVKKLYRVFSRLLRSSRFQLKLKDNLRRGILEEERGEYQ